MPLQKVRCAPSMVLSHIAPTDCAQTQSRVRHRAAFRFGRWKCSASRRIGKCRSLPSIASPIGCSDEHHEDHDSEDGYDHGPLLGARGRPKSHFRILNLPAAELALDVIRKHHLSDAAANDMIAVISATSAMSPLFSGHLIVCFYSVSPGLL